MLNETKGLIVKWLSVLLSEKRRPNCEVVVGDNESRRTADEVAVVNCDKKV